MQTRAVATDYGDVTIREWGEDTTQGDRLLLALHSMGPVSTGALYNCAVGPLVEAGYHVVAPDLPGYGLTAALPPEEYDVARLADRMWALSDALGGTRITLVGHSWGGAIAMRMQMESGPQLNALVLVDSGHVDYADVNGVDASLSLEEWVQRARDRRLVVADRAALAVALEVDAEDRLMDDLVLGVVEQDGRLVSRVTPEAQGAALYHWAGPGRRRPGRRSRRSRSRRCCCWPPSRRRPAAQRAGRAHLQGGDSPGRGAAARGHDAQPRHRHPHRVRTDRGRVARTAQLTNAGCGAAGGGDLSTGHRPPGVEEPPPPARDTRHALGSGGTSTGLGPEPVHKSPPPGPRRRSPPPGSTLTLCRT